MIFKKTRESSNLFAVANNGTEYKFSVMNSNEYNYKKHKMSVELVEEADGFTTICCNGVRYPVEIISQQQNVYKVLVNGVDYSFSVETVFSLNRKKLLERSRPISKSEIIKAPMPGKILDVMVKEGQIVSCGEPLLILEAMKMQNTINAHVGGVVNSMTAISGTSVAKDDILVEIELKSL